jgi:outer membrane protein assembly factor BamB
MSASSGKSSDWLERRLASKPATLPLRLSCLAMIVCGALIAAAQAPTNIWTLTFNSMSDSSPAISPDGTIYFGTFDGKLWAGNPDGSRKWVFKAGTEIKSSPAVGADGTIYFGCRDRKFYAVGPDGKKKWAFKTGAWVDSSPAIATDGTIYFGSWDKNLYALKSNGAKAWEFATGGPVVCSPAIGANGTIFFGSHDRKFYALSPDGKKLWEFATGGPIVSSPALDWDGAIYFTSVDGCLYVLENEGRLKWKLNTLAIREGSAVLGTNGMLFQSSNDGVWAITAEGKRVGFGGTDDLDGTPAVTADGGVIFVFRGGDLVRHDFWKLSGWRYYLFPCGLASPAIADSGTIYVPTAMTHCLVAIHATSPLAKTPWPKFRGNSRNTGNLKDSPR